MNIYIGLFRGINVGGKNILPMRELVSIIKEIGYDNIRTYIQSGNVVFSSKNKIGPGGADEISREIERKIGFSPKVLILSAKQFQISINNNPFLTNDGKALHFLLSRIATRKSRYREA